MTWDEKLDEEEDDEDEEEESSNMFIVPSQNWSKYLSKCFPRCSHW